MFKRVSFGTMLLALSVSPALAGGGAESAPTAWILHVVGSALAKLIGLL